MAKKYATKLERLQAQLADAKSLYHIIGLECEGCARIGAAVQLKNAQRRSLGCTARIHRIEAAINAEEARLREAV
jgi:hypothetical protein